MIRSPIDGVVLGLSASTIGGVFQAGSRIMDVVPANEPLQVDAMVPVQAIDKMQPGLPVDIAFPAFNHAQTPNIPGRVLTISADRLIDETNSTLCACNSFKQITTHSLCSFHNHTFRTTH